MAASAGNAAKVPSAVDFMRTPGSFVDPSRGTIAAPDPIEPETR